MEGTPGVNLLAPFGLLLFNVSLTEDNIDESPRYPILPIVPSSPALRLAYPRPTITVDSTM
jgi:hypothetical protein